MPLEIRELVIKAVVQQAGGQTGAVPGRSGDNDSKPNEQVLSICLEKVHEILKDKHER